MPAVTSDMHGRTQSLRLPALAGAFMLFLVACGPKVPITVRAGSQDRDSSNNGESGTSAGAPGAGEAGTAASSSLSGGAQGGTGRTKAKVTGLFASETEGITKDTITLCGHVPITGAAPIPHHPSRFGQFYFDHVNQELGGVHSRRVRFLVYDDRYYPAGAREAAENCARQGAFIYLGAAGTDQIVSVAKWAEDRKVPYLHGPASIKDLKGLTYNAHVGPTYEYQHELLADYLVKRFGKNVTYGMIRINSPYFDAGRDAFARALAKHGISLAVDRVVQKDESQFSDVFFELTNKNVAVVNNFTTPNIWIKMLRQRPPNYNPTWTAVSPVAGFNIVAQALSGSGNALVLHHFNPSCNCTDFRADVDASLPWYSDIQKFLEIFRRYSPEQDPPPDDFDYASYLSGKGLHRILLKLGPQPTRTKLWELIRSYAETPAETFPACSGDFTRSPDRIGAWRVNVFQLNVNKWQQVSDCIDRS